MKVRGKKSIAENYGRRWSWFLLLPHITVLNMQKTHPLAPKFHEVDSRNGLLIWMGTVLRYELSVERARCRLTYSLSSWGQRSMVWVLGFPLFLKIMPDLTVGQCVKESTKQKGQRRKCQAGNTLESSGVAFSVLGCKPVAIFPSFFIMLWFGPKTMPLETD